MRARRVGPLPRAASRACFMRLPENKKAVTGNEQQRLGNCFGDASERVCDWERGARGRAVSFWGDETFLNRCDDDIRLSDHTKPRNCTRHVGKRVRRLRRTGVKLFPQKVPPPQLKSRHSGRAARIKLTATARPVSQREFTAADPGRAARRSVAE